MTAETTKKTETEQERLRIAALLSEAKQAGLAIAADVRRQCENQLTDRTEGSSGGWQSRTKFQTRHERQVFDGNMKAALRTALHEGSEGII